MDRDGSAAPEALGKRGALASIGRGAPVASLHERRAINRDGASDLRTLGSDLSGFERGVEGLVSTVIPVHNRPGMLREAVASVIAQTYRPIEVLVVDDGSTDQTPAVAEELARDHPDEVRVLRQANGGPGQARESGRLAARGEFVQYLDSDDLLLPLKFERQVAALRADPEASICYGAALADPSEEGGGRPIRRTGEPMESILPSFLVERWWPTLSPLFRRNLLEAAGPWLPIRVEEDWEHDCRLGALGARLCRVPEAVCVVRSHAETRQSRGRALDPKRLRDRALAHERVLDHARRAGVASEAPEMARYARELFLLARQCGAAGLPAESERLFVLARRASTPRRARGIDFRLYRALSAVIGWRNAGSLSIGLDVLRDATRATG